MPTLYEASRNMSNARTTLLTNLAKQVVTACQSENVDDLVPIFSVLSQHDVDTTDLIHAIKAELENKVK